MLRLLTIIVISLLYSSCAVKKHGDILYLSQTKVQIKTDGNIPTLNIFTPRKFTETKLPVLIFVHGGNWNSGNKEMYGFFGRNFAKKDVVTVLPGYTLSPKANYDTMTKQIAQAITWTQKNITDYGGDPKQIYLTGHSAGGHLITLATLNPKYGINPQSISGIILNDAAALDMYHYLQNNPPTEEEDYLTTWTASPKIWKAASPIYFLSEESPSFKIYLGSKTYKSIDTANRRFLEALHEFQPGVELDIVNKRHAPMVLQYLWPWSDRYEEILRFINEKISPN
jgi:arylformamidase